MVLRLAVGMDGVIVGSRRGGGIYLSGQSSGLPVRPVFSCILRLLDY